MLLIKPVGSSSTSPCTASPPFSTSWRRAERKKNPLWGFRVAFHCSELGVPSGSRCVPFHTVHTQHSSSHSSHRCHGRLLLCCSLSAVKAFLSFLSFSVLDASSPESHEFRASSLYFKSFLTRVIGSLSLSLFSLCLSASSYGSAPLHKSLDGSGVRQAAVQSEHNSRDRRLMFQLLTGL